MKYLQMKTVNRINNKNVLTMVHKYFLKLVNHYKNLMIKIIHNKMSKNIFLLNNNSLKVNNF
jgi:hypothetical protein